jgi:antitoxin component YwqK of YwqJK toxin-antitoxin module
VALIKPPIRYLLPACLIASLLVIFSAISYQAKYKLTVDKSQVFINKQGERVHQNIPFTGEMVTYHTNGVLASAEQFTHGRRQGYAKKWFKDGTLGYESHYVAGAREGATRSWWSNGISRSETLFVNGKADGVAWNWYRTGEKFKRFNYIAGQSAGIQQAWRQNGKLFSNFEYKNGRIYGLRKSNNCVGLEDEVVSLDYYQSQVN